MKNYIFYGSQGTSLKKMATSYINEKNNNWKFPRLQLDGLRVTSGTRMSTTTTATTTTTIFEEIQQQLQQHQLQQNGKEGKIKRKRGAGKDVTHGFRNRDPIDIYANILEVAAKQNLRALDEIKRMKYRMQKSYFSVERNDEGIVSIDYTRKLIRATAGVFNNHIETLVKHGMMTVDIIEPRRNKFKKIPIITDKGRAFLRCYTEMTETLSIYSSPLFDK